MEYNFTSQNSKETISESKSDIPLTNVQFSKPGTFWESYISKSINLSYEEANKAIFKWSDIITFFQFWNKYPGNNIKNLFFDGNNIKYFFNDNYRINSINIFRDGIKPMWEDLKNKGGKSLQLEYKIQKEKIDEFFTAANYQWKKLILCTMGMTIPGADYINGIRFIDKTNLDRGNIIMFRIEVWVEKNINQNILDELSDFLKKNLGCENIIIKNIES